MSTNLPLRVLLLAGGLSSRMGQPKHLLTIEGIPLYLHLLQVLHEACPNALGFYMSIKDCATSPALRQHGMTNACDNPHLLPDQHDDIGPAAGLLAAYNFDSTCHWLVVACDFPMLDSTDIRCLIEAYEDPITCFKNSEGWIEPLLAIWSPTTLQRLEENVKAGRTGPNSVVKAMNGKMIKPIREQALFNANTPEQWQYALNLVQTRH